MIVRISSKRTVPFLLLALFFVKNILFLRALQTSLGLAEQDSTYLKIELPATLCTPTPRRGETWTRHRDSVSVLPWASSFETVKALSREGHVPGVVTAGSDTE